jgi:acyl-CoA hydrolase
MVLHSCVQLLHCVKKVRMVVMVGSIRRFGSLIGGWMDRWMDACMDGLIDASYLVRNG